MVAIGITRRLGVLFIGTRQLVLNANGTQYPDYNNERWPFLSGAGHHVPVPKKPLVGPWTTKKWNFLEVLVDGGACV